jgi:hypothetical protein
MTVFALYIPSISGAILALFIQTLLVGSLAMALLAYTRQYFSTRWVVTALAIGSITGVLAVLIPCLSGGPNDWGTVGVILAFVGLYVSAIAAAGGLLLGWLALLVVGLTIKLHKWVQRHKRNSAASKA